MIASLLFHFINLPYSILYSHTTLRISSQHMPRVYSTRTEMYYVHAYLGNHLLLLFSLILVIILYFICLFFQIDSFFILDSFSYLSSPLTFIFFFFNDTAPTEISPFPLPDPLPI